MIYCTSILHILAAYFRDFCNLFLLKISWNAKAIAPDKNSKRGFLFEKRKECLAFLHQKISVIPCCRSPPFCVLLYQLFHRRSRSCNHAGSVPCAQNHSTLDTSWSDWRSTVAFSFPVFQNTAFFTRTALSHGLKIWRHWRVSQRIHPFDGIVSGDGA